MPQTIIGTSPHGAAAHAPLPSDSSESAHTSRRWEHRRPALSHPLLLVLGMALVVVVAYWPSWVTLNGFWTDTADRAYTHGYLIALTSVWLIVRGRAQLAAVAVRPEPRALPILFILSALWLWCWRAALQDLHLLLLPLLLWVALIGTLGLRAARVLLFPLAFLYFAMPVWSDLVGVLQSLSIRANSALIWLTGLPAYVAGDVVHVPAGDLEIAGGCSGLHSFVVGLALAALYGELAEDPPRWRLTWLVLMGALALVANWVRIFVIVVAGYATDMRSFLITVDHYWFGWALFMLCFFGFVWLAGRLHAPHHGPRQQPPQSEADAGRGPPQVRLASAVAALLCLGALPAFGYASDRLQPAAGRLVIEWQAAPPGWIGPVAVDTSGWSPVFTNASVASRRDYFDASDHTVEVFEVAYRAQRQGAKLLGYGNSLIGDDGERQQSNGRIERSSVGVWEEQAVVDSTGQRALIWSRYRIGSRWFVEPRLAQLWYGVAALAKPVVSSLTALRAECQPECAAARVRLVSVAARVQPALRLEPTRPVKQGESEP